MDFSTDCGPPIDCISQISLSFSRRGLDYVLINPNGESTTFNSRRIVFKNLASDLVHRLNLDCINFLPLAEVEPGESVHEIELGRITLMDVTSSCAEVYCEGTGDIQLIRDNPICRLI